MKKPYKDKGKERIKDYSDINNDKIMEQEEPEFDYYDDDPYNIRVKIEHIFTSIVQYAENFKSNPDCPHASVRIKGFIGYNGVWTLTLEDIKALFDIIRTLFSHSGCGMDKISDFYVITKLQPAVNFYNGKKLNFDIVEFSPYHSDWPVDTIQVSFIQEKYVKLFDDATTSSVIKQKKTVPPDAPGESRERTRKLLWRFEKQNETDDIEDFLLQHAIKASEKDMEEKQQDSEIENIREYYLSRLGKEENTTTTITTDADYDWMPEYYDDDDYDSFV